MKLRVLATLLVLFPAAAGAQKDAGFPLPAQPFDIPWPGADWQAVAPAPFVDAPRLEAVVDRLFAEPQPADTRDTHALVVVHRGEIVAERYAPGFGAETRLASWSVAKSFTNAFAGIMVRRGAVSLAQRASVFKWESEYDARHEIRVGDLLTMTDGLDYNEMVPGTVTHASMMLFGEGRRDTAAFAASFGPGAPPGERWRYSTGAVQILSYVLQRALIGKPFANLSPAQRRLLTTDFLKRELFDPIGMTSAIPEYDASGVLLGGASIYATARDFARFGLLYLRDGVWDGRRILPEGWVDFSRTPGPAPNSGAYGALFWLQRPPGSRQAAPLLGADQFSGAFAAEGFGTQVIAILPDRDLVIVRLGATPFEHRSDVGRALAEIARCFPALEPL